MAHYKYRSTQVSHCMDFFHRVIAVEQFRKYSFSSSTLSLPPSLQTLFATSTTLQAHLLQKLNF